MAENVTGLLNRISDLDRSNIRIVSKSISTATEPYIKILNMPDYVDKVSVSVHYQESGGAIQQILFDVYKTEEDGISIKTYHNVYGVLLIEGLSSKASDVYLKLNASYLVGTLKMSSTISLNSTANLPMTKTLTLVDYPASFRVTPLNNKVIFAHNDAMQIYRDVNDDIVLDGLSNRIKVKTSASGFEDEVYIGGDSTYGVSTIKVKENLEDLNIEEVHDFFRALDVRKFNYIEEYDPEKREDVSFIIEHLQDSKFKDILIKYNEEGLDKYRINTMLMLMAAEVVSQRKEIDQIKDHLGL